MANRREEALALAEELMTDYELSRVSRSSWIAKAGRLARLLDDESAIKWLRYETVGYPREGFNDDCEAAAIRSHRHADKSEDGKQTYWTGSVAQLEATVDASRVQLSAAADPDVSISSANPSQFVMGPVNNSRERGGLRNSIGQTTATINAICGSVFEYVSAKYYELRFGSAAETAFETVRKQVDSTIARLVPSGIQMLSAAFENAASNNPEHWANAAATCRRLLKVVADALQPPGEPIDGRQMGNEQYINRLVHWIKEHEPSGTLGQVTTAELEHFGKRIDSIQDAGSKGTHDAVSRQQAARIITGTYLLVGDVLALAPDAVESAVERALRDEVNSAEPNEPPSEDSPPSTPSPSGE